MNRIDELLKKYFSGESTLNEEKELKLYFNSESVEPRHTKYAYIFQAFEREKNIVYNPKAVYSTKRLFLQNKFMYTLSGVAAAFILIFSVVRFQTNSNDYLILNGKRINDPERAREYANAKLEKSLNVLHRSLDAYKDNKIVSDKLKEIENQIK